MVKDHYIVDKERQVLEKLVNLGKWEYGKFDSECEILTFSLPYQIVQLLVQLLVKILVQLLIVMSYRLVYIYLQFVQLLVRLLVNKL